MKEKRPGRNTLVFSTILYAVCALISIYTTALLGNLIDAATQKDMSDLIRYIIICATSFVIYIIIVKLGIYFRMLYVKKQVVYLKHRLFRGLLTTPIRQFRGKDNAEYINNLTSDMDKIENDYLRSIPLVVFSIFQFVASVVVLCMINAWLVLAYSAFFLIPMLLPQLLTKRLGKYQKMSSQANEGYLFATNEIINGFETIKLEESEKQYGRLAMEATDNQQESNRKAMDLKVFLTELSNTAGSFSQLACIGFGGLFILKGIISVGDLIVSMQLINYCFSAVQLIGEKCSCMGSVLEIKKKIAILMNGNTETLNIPAGNKEVVNTTLEYKDVSFGFGDKTLYDHFNYTFEDKKTYAIVGESGIGKTTLAKLALRYYEPTSGEIRLDNQDLESVDESGLYQKIKYVSQTPYLFNDTIIHNITMLHEYDEKTINDILEYTNLTELVHQTESEKIGDFGNKISGGEKQRIALARVLLSNPEIIFFDEPTSSLDPENQKLVEHMIFNLKNITRIVITHNQTEKFLSQFDEVVRL